MLNRWSRSDEVVMQAKSYLKAVLGNHHDVDRLALLACQDLVTLKVMSLQDNSSYKVFRKSPNCYVYLHTRLPTRKAKCRSGLKW